MNIRSQGAARTVALAYAAASALWIFLADIMAGKLTGVRPARELVPLAHSLLHIAGSVVFIYVLVRRVNRPLERERSWYVELFAMSPDAILVIDARGRIVEANETAVERYGYREGELLGMDLRDLSPPDLRDGFDARLDEALDGDGRFEWRHVNAGGSIIIVDAVVRRIDRYGAPCILCKVRDVTGYRLTVETLQRSEEVQRSLVECSPVALYSVDREGRVLTWNPAAERITGIPAQDAVGRIVPFLAPEDLPGFKTRLTRALAGEDLSGFEIVRRRKDGSTFTGRVSTAPIHGPDGGVVALMTALEDITGYREAESELRESERRFRRAVEESPLPMLIHADDGEILAISRAVGELTGHRLEELRTIEDWTALAYGIHAERIRAIIARTHELTGRHDDGEYRVQCRDGSMRYWAFSSMPLGHLPDGRHVVFSVAADLTERRQAEHDRAAIQKQLYHAQRLEAVGKLAGGIAHDFNNILQAILGYSRLLLDQEAGSGLLREGLEEIHHGAERATALTGQLLAFSRRQVLQPALLDANAVVGDMLKMVRRVIGEHIRLEWVPGAGLAPVRADPGMLGQVLMNLCVNARDAMPNGGVMTVETRETRVDEDLCAVRGWITPGRFLELTVADTGVGITPEVLEHIFEPFYTTKEDLQGTGLGLATVHGIVSQHGGMVHVETEANRGSRFHVYLPVGVGEIEPVRQRDPEVVATGHETILVAEDDESVRQLAARVLSLAGYGVLTARDGEEAAEIFAAQAGGIDLVVLDVMMPRLGGEGAFRRIAGIRPDIPAMFSSGYAEEGIHTDFVLNEGLTLLQKPYSPGILLRAIRDKLDGNR